MRKLSTILIVGAFAIMGCMSLEERLKSEDLSIRRTAERELVQSSRLTGSESNRVAAVNRVTDKDYLYEIARNACNKEWVAEDVSFDASGYSAYQSDASGKNRVYYRATAYGIIYDRVSGSFVDTTKDGMAALQKLALDFEIGDDRKKIVELILKAESSQIRMAAFSTIMSPERCQPLVGYLAARAPDAAVREAALAKTTMDKGFAEIVKNATDEKSRLAAFGKLHDRQIIDNVVLKTKDRAVLLAGIPKVSNKAVVIARVFSGEFATNSNNKAMLDLDDDLIVKSLCLVRDDEREGIQEKLSKDGKWSVYEKLLARIYCDKVSQLPQGDGERILSWISTPEIFTKMLVPPTESELRKEEMARKSKADKIRREIGSFDNEKGNAIDSARVCTESAERARGGFDFSRARKYEAESEEWKVKAAQFDVKIAELKRQVEELEKPQTNSLYVADEKVRTAICSKVGDETLYVLATNMVGQWSSADWRSDSDELDTLKAACTMAANIREKRKRELVCITLLGEAKKKVENRLRREDVFSSSVLGQEVKEEDISDKWRRFTKKWKEWRPLFNNECVAATVAAGCQGSELALVMVDTWDFLAEVFKDANAGTRKLLAEKMTSKVITGEMCFREKDPEVRALLLKHADVSAKGKYAKLLKADGERLIAMAKGKGATTFELDGFYLGMSFDDAVTLAMYHFPEWEMSMRVWNDGTRSLHVLGLVFCWATKDGKVYQFNFGKKMLKKWYRYDVQTFDEWAHAYSRENKINMHPVRISKEVKTNLLFKEVRGGYFTQESYQFKHNAKGYRLTYFGERDEHNDVIEDDVLVKNAMATALSRQGGAVGALRVELEED